MADLIGTKLGAYTITEHLGRGGMADVYKAHHDGLSTDRAIKIIRPEFVAVEGFTERFRKEAQSVARLRHRNIVQVHDFCVDGALHYMVMEYIDGKDLKQFIVQDGPLRPVENVVRIISQIADAIAYAHRAGIVHRDIKPQNILIDKEDNAILTDFGIAKILDSDSQLTRTGMSIGTPAYMAPEQAQGNPRVGPAADIYALTVVLYEALTGRAPYEADTPLATLIKAMNDPVPVPGKGAGISEGIQEVVAKGMAKDPEQRHHTAEEFREALQSALRSKADQQDTEVLADHAKPSASGARWWPVLVVLAAVAVGAWLVRSHLFSPAVTPSPAETQRPEAEAITAIEDPLPRVALQKPQPTAAKQETASIALDTAKAGENAGLAAETDDVKSVTAEIPQQPRSSDRDAQPAPASAQPRSKAEAKDVLLKAQQAIPESTKKPVASAPPPPAHLADKSAPAKVNVERAAKSKDNSNPTEEDSEARSKLAVVTQPVRKETPVTAPPVNEPLTAAPAHKAERLPAVLELPWEDTFSDNSPAADWEIQAQPHQVNIDQSELLLSPSENNTTLLLRAAVSGDFTATVKVNAQITQHTWSRLAYVVDETTRLEVGVWGTCCNHGRWPTFTKTVGREARNLMYQQAKLGRRKLAAYADAPQVWHLRLNKSGNRFTGSVSIDGKRWQDIGVHTLATARGRLGLIAGKERRGVPNIARFDDFEVVPGP